MFSLYLIFFIQHILGFQLSGVFCPPWKNVLGGGRVEEKDFHSVIQRRRVNASILFLTTSINCRSDSPTHSTFLLEGEAETLRLKWDEECSKRCCSCPFLTPSPPLIPPFPLRTRAETNTHSHTFTETRRGTQTLHVTRRKHLINSGSHRGTASIHHQIID